VRRAAVDKMTAVSAAATAAAGPRQSCTGVRVNALPGRRSPMGYASDAHPKKSRQRVHTMRTPHEPVSCRTLLIISALPTSRMPRVIPAASTFKSSVELKGRSKIVSCVAQIRKGCRG
jgi:hypothetical protein